MKEVLVIGAGVCGLTALKSCLEVGIDAVCFEQTERLGGLWHYHNNDEDDVASCMKTTVINTSKDLSAFSDFPPPKEFPNYMHNRHMLKYFQMYAERFNLYPYIKHHHEVISVSKAADYLSSGRWLVVYRNSEGQTEKVFDGIMVCIGHHVKPHIPEFPDQEKFQGRIVHTHSLKVPDAFKDCNVVVVGTGNSGVDAAVDISLVAKQVYLSTRRGFWLVHRVGEKGLPSDAQLHSRYHTLFPKIFGQDFCNNWVEGVLNQKFDHEIYGLKPKHRFFSQHPTINDHLPDKILNGTVIVKQDLLRFDEKGVVFGREGGYVTPTDAVVLATGYKIVFPFLKDDILRVVNNKLELYKHTFPPNLGHPSLAIIGLVQPNGSIFPIAESQSRWFCELITGKVKLPLCPVMWKDIRKRHKDMGLRYVESPRHTIQVDYVNFLDDVAEEYGAKPDLWRIAVTDPRLFWKCFMGPCLAYQYRLNGPYPWPGARNAILSHKRRLLYPLTRGKQLAKKSTVVNNRFVYLICILCLFIYVFKGFFLY